MDEDEAYVPEEDDEHASTDDANGGEDAAVGGSVGTPKSSSSAATKPKQQRRSRVRPASSLSSRKKKSSHDPSQTAREDEGASGRVDISKQLNLSAPMSAHQLEVSDENILAMGGCEFIHIAPFSLVLQSDFSDFKSHQEAIKFEDVGDMLPLVRDPGCLINIMFPSLHPWMLCYYRRLPPKCPPPRVLTVLG